jgi:hypothetical protein
MLFAWYIYASPRSKAVGTLVGFANKFRNRITAQYVADPDSTSATTRYLVSDFSSETLSFLRSYNILVGGIMIVGLGLVYVRLLRNRDIEFDSEYVAYATVALVIFGITFLPVERFNTARTYPTTLLFYAPFFVLGIKQPIDVAKQYVGPVGRINPHQIATLVLVVFLALNVGFVSAVFTDEYSTNALVEKDRIMDDGAPPEKNYFYKQYPTVHGVESTGWLRTNGANGSTLYQSNWPGGTEGAVGHAPISVSADGGTDTATFDRRVLRRGMFTENGSVGEGYLFFNAFNHERLGNIIRLPSGHFAFEYVRTSEASDHWSDKHLVYANGGSRVYYGQNRTTFRPGTSGVENGTP